MRHPTRREAVGPTRADRLGVLLRTHRPTQVGELVVVFAAAVGVMLALRPVAGEGFLAGALPGAAAILVQLGLVWLGLRLRGERCDRLGLRLGRVTGHAAIGVVWRGIVALVLGLVGFVVGAIVGANIFGMPEGANLSAYNPLAGNLPLLLATLAGVYVTASFGEEVIYRGFLINRVETLVGSGGGEDGGGRLAVGVALGVSAAMFGLAHWTWGGVGMVETAFMGLGLGGAYLLFGRNLWVTILAHGVMDTTLMVQMYLGAQVGGGGGG